VGKIVPANPMRKRAITTIHRMICPTITRYSSRDWGKSHLLIGGT
jgi:hypothetical protein